MKYTTLNNVKTVASHIVDWTNKKVPESGTAGQVLTYKSSGESQWKNLSDVVNLTDVLAYGVEFDVTVSDPHLTRIGNMSMHKTLPIQSQLKGCVAQGGKVMYWLGEDDWHLKKGDDYGSSTRITVSGSSTTGIDIPMSFIDALNPLQNIICYGSRYLSTKYFTPEKIKAAATSDGTNYHLSDLSLLTSSDFEAEFYLVPGSDLSGYDGTVKVFVPSFYIKSEIIGNKRRVWLSTVRIDDTWTYQPSVLVDAYRCTVLNTVPTDMGYLSTLPVNSAISVVNTSTYCRGGANRSAYDTYLSDNPSRSDLGKPRSALGRSTMRTYARNAGNEMLSYDQYKNIFYWLYVVEYANFNSQEAYNSSLTTEGYHQGGLGNGVTTMSNWDKYNGYYAVTPCGYGNRLGNKTGVESLTLPSFSYNDTNYPAQTLSMPRWRGFDNPFGDLWTNLDGIIIDADADNHPNNMNYVYTCSDSEHFGDTLTDYYTKVGEEIHTDGCTKIFDLGNAAHIIPNAVGAGTTTYICDYHYTGSKNTTLRSLLVCGCAHYGALAGLGHFNSYYGVSDAYSYVGFRSVALLVEN